MFFKLLENKIKNEDDSEIKKKKKRVRAQKRKTHYKIKKQ